MTILLYVTVTTASVPDQTTWRETRSLVALKALLSTPDSAAMTLTAAKVSSISSPGETLSKDLVEQGVAWHVRYCQKPVFRCDQ